MLEASWRTADAVVAQKTRQTDPKDVGLSEPEPRSCNQTPDQTNV
jgi:hypothetical protein